MRPHPFLNPWRRDPLFTRKEWAVWIVLFWAVTLGLLVHIIALIGLFV